jgi:hypothetical protein
VVSVHLDVQYVADLLDGREWFTRYALPGRRAPVPELDGNLGVIGLELAREITERGERAGIHVHAR